jgi:coenzyme PQQ synthesis protein D (PqqD)
MLIVLDMTDAARYRPNSPPILHETIEHETIIVNLDAGIYYSLNPAATTIWQGLDDGASIEQIVRGLAEQSGTATDEVAQSVRLLIEQLLQEELITTREDGGESAGVVPWPDDVSYEPPLLRRYTDMQELLLLDPVHDVGVGGWPQAR